MKKVLFLITLNLISCAFAHDKSKLCDASIDVLDCNCTMQNNSLKGIKSFTVFIPQKSPEADSATIAFCKSDKILYVQSLVLATQTEF